MLKEQRRRRGGKGKQGREGGRREVGGVGGSGIDLPPGVMDGAISGSGRRRREESDFCFSTS